MVVVSSANTSAEPPNRAKPAGGQTEQTDLSPPPPIQNQIRHHHHRKQIRYHHQTETTKTPAKHQNSGGAAIPPNIKTTHRSNSLHRGKQQNHRGENTNPHRKKSLLQLRCSPERTEGAVVRRTTVTRRTTYGRNLHREVYKPYM
ncbi:hypothetical protein QL285_057174 [Trifolium repens]|nr:hypothetical protein QL285_057174 [Trifolium repens]